MAKEDLGEYEGKPIRKMAIEVRNTAGGLNAAIKVDPSRIHPGERRIVAYDVVFDKFRFDPMDEGDAWCLVAIGSASTAAFLDPTVVQAELEKSKQAAIELADEKAGRKALDPGPDGVAMKLSTEHAAGEHKRRRKACPDCYPPGEEGATVTTIGGGRKRGRASASE
jgi:hypothetical protein